MNYAEEDIEQYQSILWFYNGCIYLDNEIHVYAVPLSGQ